MSFHVHHGVISFGFVVLTSFVVFFGDSLWQVSSLGARLIGLRRASSLPLVELEIVQLDLPDIGAGHAVRVYSLRCTGRQMLLNLALGEWARKHLLVTSLIHRKVIMVFLTFTVASCNPVLVRARRHVVLYVTLRVIVTAETRWVTCRRCCV